MDEIRNYNLKKDKERKKGDRGELDLLFQRNQSSMEELIRLREELISINVMKQLERLK